MTPRSDAPPTRAWSSARRAAVFAVVALVVAVAYAPALRAGFVYDDRLVVLRNPAIAGFDLGALLRRPMWAFYSPEAELQVGYWRPLASVLLAAVYAAAGPVAAAFHGLSLGLHLAACAAAWALARRLTRSDLVGAWAALLFGLHPVHVESTAWISAVGDPLYGCLALVAIERHLAWRERGSPGAPWLAGTLILAALLAKELAVGAILAIVALDLVLGARPLNVRAWLPYAAAFLVYWAGRAVVFQSALAGFDRTTTHFGVPWTRLVVLRAEILGRSLAALAWPADLRLFHPFVPDAGAAGLLVPLLALGAWTALCVLLARARARVLLAAALLAPVPLLALVVRVGQLGVFPYSERYLYLAAFGAALLFAAAVLRWLPRSGATGLLAVVAAAFAVTSYSQAGTWRDEETLFRTAAERSPRVPYARYQYGRVLLERYRREGGTETLRLAEREFQAGLDLLLAAKRGDASIFATRDDGVQTNVGMGWVLVYEADFEGEHDYRPAARIFEEVVKTYPESEEGWTGLGVARMALDDLDGAEEAFRSALAINERFVEAHRNLGRLYMRREEPQKARDEFEAALRWQPDQVDSLLLLGAALERMGDDAAAMVVFEDAGRVAPHDVRPLVQRGVLAAKAGVLDGALRILDEAVEMDPNSADAQLERAWVQAARGEQHAALASFVRACELAPNSFEAHYGAAALLLPMEGVPQAMPYMIRAYETRPKQGGWTERIADAIRGQEIASPEAFLLLATADADRGETDLALAWLEDALALKPDFVQALYLKGGMLKRKGETGAARATWERVVELAPDNFEVHDSLAGLSYELGDHAGALRHLEEAERILVRALPRDPGLEEPLKMLRVRMEQLRAER